MIFITKISLLTVAITCARMLTSQIKLSQCTYGGRAWTEVTGTPILQNFNMCNASSLYVQSAP